MAELQNSKSKGAPKPDMTPLVDLAFLLITFFMYTTTFTQPVNLPFAQPVKDQGTSDLLADNTLTLILGKNDSLYYHQSEIKNLNGLIKFEGKQKAFRKFIVEKRNASSIPDNFTVILKPTGLSSYKGFVDLLDEMLITNQTRYALVDITEQELAYVPH